jgi:hypothetical protein
MPDYSANKCVGVSPVSAGDCIVKEIDNLLEESHRLRDLAFAKLDRLVGQDSPVDPCSLSKADRPFPPYFEYMKEKIRDINANVESVKRLINRVDI